VNRININGGSMVVKTRVNGRLLVGKSVSSIFGKLLKRPLHQIKDNNLTMVDIQKTLLKKKGYNVQG